MRADSARRSLTKAITYRIFVMCMDFATIYFFTGAVHVALGFMLVSNIYTSFGYVLHERLWAKIQWGVDDR